MNSPNTPFGDVSGLQNEITYGQNYRNIILSQQKPINKTRQTYNKIATTIRKKPWRYGKGFLCKNKKNAKLSLLERNALTQEEYMRILAIPKKIQKKRSRHVCSHIKIKKKRMLTTYCACTPHIKQLALPKKRYVLETWKQFQDLLAPEVLVRFNEILHYESHRLDINEASCYFKQLNLKKRKKRRRKHKKLPSTPKWLRHEIWELARIICNLIKQETVYELDWKQYLLSEAILDFLVEKRVIKRKPQRNTRNFCLKSIMEVCDKLSMWFDEFGESAGLKPSLLEDLVIITSQLSLIEEEGEGEEESEEEEEGEGEEVEEESEDDGLGNLFIRELDQSESESELEFDYEQEGFDFLSHLSEDSLGRLIRILANSSDEYLDSYLDPRLWPNARNRDVLEKLIELRNGLLNLEGTRTNRLEELMTLWAKRNQPDQVDDRIQNKIQVTSRLIAELLGLYEKEDKDVQPSPSFLAAYEADRRRRRPGESSSESGESSISLGLYPDQDVGDSDDLLGVIRAHKPPKTYPHSPDKICCLSLKIWAIWLMNVTQNLHKWTKWLISIIKQIREFAARVRDPTKKLYKQEWRDFCKDTDDKIVTWRQYSKHVRELSDEIIENFHGKPVFCCPACLYNHKIPNVVQAHETIQALVEAINCAAYWHRCLDKIVDQAGSISDIDVTESKSSEGTSSTTTESIEIIETVIQPSEESVYVIEEIPTRN